MYLTHDLNAVMGERRTDTIQYMYCMMIKMTET